MFGSITQTIRDISPNFDINATATTAAQQDFESGAVNLLNGVATANNVNEFITLIFSRYLIFVLIFFAFIVLDNWSAFQRLISSVFVGMGGKAVIAVYVKRDRPYMQMNLKTPSGADMGFFDSFGSSMPSGHSIVAFAIATCLALEASKALKQRTITSKWVAYRAPLAAAVMAGLVGLSRVAYGFHYLSDVGAGLAVGAGSALTIHALF